MKKISLIIVAVILASFSVQAQKLVSTKSHIKFFSHTVAEDIEANNYKAVGTINIETGDVVFSVPMQSFEFEKSLMQKHYNSPKFLDTKAYPKTKLVGKISNMTKVNFKKDGVYEAIVKGEMNMHGETNTIEEKATITVKGGNVSVMSKFNMVLADYKVAFEKGKPSTNIAKSVEVSINAEYAPKK